MTPEAGLFLDKARQSLAIADYMAGEWPAEAGRVRETRNARTVNIRDQVTPDMRPEAISQTV